MSTLTEQIITWDAGVFQLETTTPVKGGAVAGALDAPTDGEANAQAQVLANRTGYLKQLADADLGVVKMFAGSSLPYGHLWCDGAEVSRTTYADLFAVLGESHGRGDSFTTFDLPDYRGRFIRGVDDGEGNDPDAASRTAMNTGGNTGDDVGTLQDEELKAHTHGVSISDGAETGTTPVADQVLDDVGTTFASDATGGSETRPVNASVNFIIRAIV